jgi:hypothetical protein
MTDVLLNVGTIVKVSAAVPATYDDTGYEALTWTTVGNVEKMSGDIGGSKTVTNFMALGTGTVNKLAGSIDYGKMGVDAGLVAGDAGLIICKAGYDGANRNATHSIMIQFSDTKVAYATGIISKCSVQTGDANSVRMVSLEFDIKTKWVSDLFAA